MAANDTCWPACSLPALQEDTARALSGVVDSNIPITACAAGRVVDARHRRHL